MNIHVKIYTDEQAETFDKLVAFLLKNSTQEVKIQKYGRFASIEMVSDWHNALSTLINEERYMNKKYILHIFERENHVNCFNLPIENIDCIIDL